MKETIYKYLAITSFIVCVTIWYFSFSVYFFGLKNIAFVSAATVTWDGGGSGDDWCTDANWSTDAEPTSADDVIIDSEVTVSTFNCLGEGKTLQFNSLSIGGTATTTFGLGFAAIGSGGSITVKNLGVLQQIDTSTYTITGTLTVESGGIIKHSDNSTGQSAEIDLSVGGLNIQSGGSISIDGLGYDGGPSANPGTNGYGPGAGAGGSSAMAGGGGYGGSGGNGMDGGSADKSGGVAYGSISAPVFIGSGGGSGVSAAGGAGGGAAKIVITGGGTATLSGTVTAKGASGSSGNGNKGGGGSGGSFWISFSSGGTIAGNGTINVDGGSPAGSNGTGEYGGGGGGGRIAITGYTTNSFSGTYSYNGGFFTDIDHPQAEASDGAGGTLWLQRSSTNGDLYVGRVIDYGDFTITPVTTTMSIDSVSFLTGAYLQLSAGTTLTMSSSTMGSVNATNTAYFDAQGTLSVPTTFTVPATVQLQISPSNFSGVSALIVAANGTLQLEGNTTSTAWSLSSVVVSGILTHKTNSSTVAHSVNINANTITVNSGGYISSTGRGYSGGAAQTNGNGPGAGTYSNPDGGGGAYGGNGGSGATSGANGGTKYGTTSTPLSYAGSGGAGSYYSVGGGGGGVIHLLVSSTLTVDGIISANGGTGRAHCGATPAGASGGGSGGGILLEATTLAGSGTITANGGNGGGNGSGCNGGGGGGGRVLITVDTNSFSGTTSTAAGSQSGSGGTAGTTGTFRFSPQRPTVLYSNSTDASGGSVNPTRLTTTTPVFSAIYNGTSNATKARIQVSTSSSFSSVTHWDVGSGGSSITSCANGIRCNNITFGNLGSSPTQSLSLNDDADENTDTVYYWRIQYIDTDDVASSFSATSTFTLLDVPNEVSGMTTSSLTATSFTLSWTDNSSIEDNYLVSYATDGATFGNTSTLAASSVTTNFSSLTPNTQYTVSVQGTNTAGNSSRVTLAPYTLANVPSALVSTAQTSNSITMQWTANSNPAGTEYCIVQGSGTCSASDWQTSQTKTITGLSGGSTYTFKVKARNALGQETSFTDTVSAATSQAGGGGDAGGGGSAPPVPPAIPPVDEPPLEPLAPTGLIQIINSSVTDVLGDAGLKNHKVSSYTDVKMIPDTNNIFDLSKPFRLEVRFTLNASPYARSGQNNTLISKSGAYYMGYENITPLITQTGFCFGLRNTVTRVCDKNPDISAFEEKHYVVRWDGSILSLLNGDETQVLGTLAITQIPSNNKPIAIGGTQVEYAPGQFGYSYFPQVIHDFNITQVTPVSYTNKRDVTLKIDSTYSNLLFLRETDGEPDTDFTTAELADIKPELSWALKGADGKKCVNAKFLNQPSGGAGGSYEYVTYACVYLDTTKPGSSFTLNKRLDATVSLSGKSEPRAKIVITKVKKANASGWIGVDGALNDGRRAGVVAFSSTEDFFARVAAYEEIYSTTANEAGDWTYDFAQKFTEGTYSVSVQSTDLAGNTSNKTEKTIKISADEEIPPEEIPPLIPPEEIPPLVPPVEDPPVDEPPTTPPDDSGEGPADPGDQSGPSDSGNGSDNGNSGDTGNGNNGNNDSGNTTDGGSQAPGSDTTNNTDNSVTETIVSLPGKVIDTVRSVISTVGGAVSKVIDNPTVEAANEKVVAPALLVAGVANVVVGVHVTNIVHFAQYLFSQPAMLARRRKKKTWGVVYNGYTKQPVDLATVRVVDNETGRVLRTQVTDTHGRYFLFVPKGTYRIEIIKPGFIGFSEHLKEKTEDAKYSHLYHGETFTTEGEQESVTYNIPLEPDIQDRPTKDILRDHSKKLLQHALSLIGLVASVVSFIITPTWMIGCLIAAHILFYVIFHRISHQKLPDKWGLVRSIKDKTSLPKVVVRVFDSAYNKLINTAVTDNKGRYAVLVGPSTYYVTYDKEGFKQKKSPQLDYTEEKTDGVGGIITRDEHLTKE